MSTILRTLLFSVIFLCSYHCLFASDSTKVRTCKILLTNGKEFVGEIVAEDSVAIVIKNEFMDSQILKSRVRQITYFAAGESGSEERVFVPEKKENNTEVTIGATFGTPAVGNIRVGVRTEKLAFHYSGGYWGDVFGFQLNPMLLLSKDEKTYHYLSALIGYSHLKSEQIYRIGPYTIIDEGVNWLYGGVGYVFNTRGFFLELGLSAGTGSFTSPQLMFQIGYVN